VARRGNVLNLQQHTTPIALAVNQLTLRIRDNPTDTTVLERSLSPHVLAEIQRYFPSWAALATAHPEIFALHLESNILMLSREKEREMVRTLPLEAQLEHAIRTQNKKKMRSLRRRILQQQNPDNPLLEPENLCRAVAEFLPPQGHLPLRQLMHSLPLELLHLLPNQSIRFFKNNTAHFSLFEFGRANRFHVARAGLPLPPGCLRSEYSHEELVLMVAQRLQRKPTQSLGEITTFLSQSARDTLRKYGGLPALLARYPDCFTFIARKENIADAATLVTMLQLPPFARGAEEGAGGDE
jgi:hypothetical protein